MDKHELKKLIKNEIAPLLIGIRNDIDSKTQQPLIDKIEGVLLRGKKGEDGYTPIADKDYPSEKTVFAFIKDNLPKKGKDYFTEKDIKDIVSDVFKLIPSKEELKGKDGLDGQVDYSIVESLAKPLIENKYKQIQKYIDDLTNKTIKAIENNKIPELSAEKIRNKLESLKGNARLDAKAIKGLENYMQTFIATSSGGGGGGGGSTPDLSGYVPYIGATSNLNLGNNSLNVSSITSPFNAFRIYNTGAMDFAEGLASITANGDGYFQNAITASVSANSSAGLSLNNNTGTTVALLGAGSGTGVTFYGGVVLNTMTSGSILFAGSSGLISQDNSNFFWDDANNRLGIGTTAPASKFQVESGRNDFSGFYSTETGSTVSMGINIGNTISGTAKRNIGSFGVLDSIANYSVYFRNAYDGEIKFQTNGNVDRLKIDSTRAYFVGNVGIGTTAPTGQLHIVTAGSFLDTVPSILAGKAVTTGNSLGASFRNFTGTTGNAMIEIAGITSGAARPVQLRTDSSGNFGVFTGSTAYSTIGTERFTILQGGNIGVGTSSPTKKLDINTSTAGDGIKAGVAQMGNWLGSASYAFFGYSGLADTAYAIIQNSAGATLFNSASSQILGFNIGNARAMTVSNILNVGIGTASPSARLHINSTATSDIVQIVKGFSGQTANLTEWQTNAGTVIDRVDKDGIIHRGDTIEWSETKALTAGAGGYIELGTMLGASIGSGSTIEIYLQWYVGGNAQSRKYIVCGAYNAMAGVWLRVEPYSEYNGYGNSVELDAINSGANTKFRIIAPSTTNRPTSVFVTYKLTNPYLRTTTQGLSTVWTASSTTGTDTSTLSPYPYTVVRQRQGELHISNKNSTSGYSKIVAKESQTGETGTGTKGINLWNSGRVTVDGSFGNAGGEFYGMTVSVPNATNDYCEFATISTGSFTAGVEIWTSVRQGGYAVSKRYMIQMDYGATGGAWHKLMPIASSGPYSGNDQDLEISITTSIATIRVRRVSGATTNATMYVGILIGAIESSVSVTQINNTGTTTAPTIAFSPTTISQINGRVGMGSLTGDNPNSTLDLKGTLALPYIEKTSTYTISDTDHTINCTSGTFTVNLPTAVGISGRIYVIKNSGAGTITLDGNGTETIDGLTTQSITTGLVMKVQSTGSNWIII